MIDHMSTYATDFDKTRAFYASAFESLGYSVQMEFVAEWNVEWPTQRMCAFGPEGKPAFWIIESKEASTPRHTAFAAQNRAAVDAFYQKGLESGGTDNGGPGLREHYHKDYYGAFLIDPDGNNVEAVCHLPE